MAARVVRWHHIVASDVVTCGRWCIGVAWLTVATPLAFLYYVALAATTVCAYATIALAALSLAAIRRSEAALGVPPPPGDE